MVSIDTTGNASSVLQQYKMYSSLCFRYKDPVVYIQLQGELNLLKFQTKATEKKVHLFMRTPKGQIESQVFFCSIFSRASAKAERDLSSLLCMCVYVDQNRAHPLGIP